MKLVSNKNIVDSISGIALKELATSARECQFLNSGIRLNGKYSHVTLNLAHFGASLAELNIKKIGGNGKISIYQKPYVRIDDIIPTQKTLNIYDPNIIEINRGDNGTGAVELVSIKFAYDQISGVVVSNTNWKAILANCIDYKHIRIIDGRAFISEGAYIETAGVNNVITRPNNMFSINGNKIKFLGTCELISLSVIPKEKVQSNIGYDYISPPVQVISPVIENNTTVQQPLQIPSNLEKPTTQQLLRSQNIVFDSLGSSLLNYSNIGVKSAGKSLLMGRKGKVTIPISSLKPNTNYILMLESNKAVGNGKIEAYITPSGEEAIIIQFATAQLRNIPFNIKSGYSDVDGFKLIIKRPDSATGEIIINRVLLIEGNTIHSPQPFQKEIAGTYESYSNFYISNEFTVVETDMMQAHGVYKMEETDLKFVVVIPSYKNEAWVERNLNSVFNQSKQNYRVIFIDDCSPDETFNRAKSMVEAQNQTERTTLIRNTQRLGALYNLYTAIHSCDDNEIIITVDGDDWFAHERVLDKLTEVYSNTNVWMTYGQYQSWPDNGAGCSTQIPQHITEHNSFRQFRWCSSHLRTFYAWLFKRINKEDLLDRAGNFYSMAWDLGFMFPMLEISGHHAKFIPDVLYIYNVANPINDSKVNLQLQQSLEREIRAKRKYDRL